MCSISLIELYFRVVNGTLNIKQINYAVGNILLAFFVLTWKYFIKSRKKYGKKVYVIVYCITDYKNTFVYSLYLCTLTIAKHFNCLI